ncbi:MAG: hypothetical protein WCG04_06130 [Alphaproteobacteria bacterium]
MKTVYLADAHSRSFDFSAIGETEKDAKKALMLAFSKHAKQYNLPSTWWRDAVDFNIIEMQLNTPYRDRSEIK